MRCGYWQLSVVYLSVVLGGCTITRTATPVTLQRTDPRDICVIEDPAVDETFLPAYRTALEAKRFTIKLLSPGSPVDSCPLTSTYYARWSWDFTPYMSLAKIVVYKNGVQVGDAVYDAPKAGMAMTFEIYESTTSKVSRMVSQLFPITE